MQHDLPEFLYNKQNQQIVCCVYLRLRKEKTCLVLTRQLKFYEFQCKKLLHYIDLRQTCLQQISERLNSYTAPIGMHSSSSSSSNSNQKVASTNVDTALLTHAFLPEAAVYFGKYIYRNRHIYILISCWDKLIVLQRPASLSDSYKIIAEYADVTGYRLINSRISYQALVELQFQEGQKKVCTDFQEKTEAVSETIDAGGEIKTSRAEFRQLLQRVENARAELQVHRAMTQRDFMHLSKVQTFGQHLHRSPLLEELPLVMRCGDIWWRISADDALIMGVPLVNQAGVASLSSASNLRPLLYVETTNKSDCDNGSGSGGISYEFRLFQLRTQLQEFNESDNATLFFETQDASLQALAWHSVTQMQLLPEASAVLLVKLNLMQLLLHAQAQLFLSYELNSQEQPRQQQQLFLKTISIADLLQQRQQHAISFSSSATLHQDFLASIMSHAAMCCLELTFNTAMDAVQFTQILITKYEFSVSECNDMGSSSSSILRDCVTPDGIDMDDDDAFNANGNGDCTMHTSTLSVYYNRQTTSQWHGMLMLRESLNDLRFKCTFYARSETKLCLMLRLLFEEQLHYKCNLTDVQLLNADDVTTAPGIQLEHALRQELHAWHTISKQKQKSQAALKNLYKLQLDSDLLTTVIKTNSDLV